MQYETLYLNDNATAKVRMTVNGKVLEQDFPVANLDDNVKQGMAVFACELERNKPVKAPKVKIGDTVTVDVLPEIPAEDLLPEPVEE